MQNSASPPFGRNYISAECAKCRGKSARPRERGSGKQRDRVFYLETTPTLGERLGEQSRESERQGEVGNYAIISLPRVRALARSQSGIGSLKKYAPRDDRAGFVATKREDYVDDLRFRFSSGSVARCRSRVTRFVRIFAITCNCRPVVDDKRRIELNSLFHIVKHCCKVPS